MLVCLAITVIVQQITGLSPRKDCLNAGQPVVDKVVLTVGTHALNALDRTRSRLGKAYASHTLVC
jgi:hypothetical protein